MSIQLPVSPENFLRAAHEFWTEIREVKRNNRLLSGEWYPFDTLSCIETLTALVSEYLAEVLQIAASSGLVDIGCGDGDMGLLFGHFGMKVDAVDFIPNNYNAMEGVEALSRLTDIPLRTFSLDLNATSSLPEASYGLALVLGTLYHLKNPYGFLERLAY